MKAWTLDDQLALVAGSRWARLKYRLHQARAKVAADRSHGQWVADVQGRNRGLEDGNVLLFGCRCERQYPGHPCGYCHPASERGTK